MLIKRVVFAAGAVLVVAGLFWGRVIGFYQDQLVWVVALLLVGAALMGVAHLLPRTDLPAAGTSRPTHQRNRTE